MQKDTSSYFSLSFNNGIILANLNGTMKVNRSVASIFFIIILGSFFNSRGQNSDIISQVSETIKAGSAKELSKYLNQTVDVMIEEKLESFSKAQAEFVLRDFFKAHPASEFNIIHQGSSKGGQPFAIGLYKSGKETYRVFMKIKNVGNQPLVHEIRFSKE